MTIDYKALGKRIRLARIQAEHSQEKLAEIVGISPTHLSNVETGTTRVSLTTLVTIANALDVTLDDLLCDSIRSARIQFEGELAAVVNDCTEYELRVVTEVASAAKRAMRQNDRLRGCDR